MKKPYTDIRLSSLPIHVRHIIYQILDREGGKFTDHENDWPTKWGIRKLSADRAGYKGRIEDIDQDTAGQIWASLFWYGPNLHVVDHVSTLIAETVLDTAGPAGLRIGITHLQEALTSFNKIEDGQRIYGEDLSRDGIIGPKTIEQLEKYLDHRRGQQGTKKLATRLNCLQDAHYCRIAIAKPGKRDFSFGWNSTRVFADLVELAKDTDPMYA